MYQPESSQASLQPNYNKEISNSGNTSNVQPGPSIITNPEPLMLTTTEVEVSNFDPYIGHDEAIDVLPEQLNKPSKLVHLLKTGSSILALAVGDQKIYAGTQDGEIIVWSLKTFELVQRIQAHTRSILCLHLFVDGGLLFSSAGDSIVNVWCSRSLKLLNHIYSTYDVGDVFSIAYSTQFQRVYLGSQNTSIQWCCLKDSNTRPPPNLENHPDRRNHSFFDSVGAGGTSTPRSPSTRSDLDEDTLFEIDESHMLQYAHFGYVYCIVLVNGTSRLLDLDNDVLISGGGDGTIKLWETSHDLNQGIKEIACLGTDDAESVLSIAVDGSFLYSSKHDGIIELWDLDTQQKVRVTKVHDGDVTTLQLGWGYLFNAGSTGFAGKYNTSRYNEPRGIFTCNQTNHSANNWKAHEGRIMASAITEDNNQKLYITGASDKTVSVWEIIDHAPGIEKEAEVVSDNQLIRSLQDFVSFKTISSRTNHAEDCRRGATFLRKLFKKHGAETEMLNTDNQWNPIVYAKFKGNPSSTAMRKKILFYGHYDVVPADNNQNKWIVDPFEMKGVNGYLYGRGVSDNKGPIMAALYGVVDLIHEKELESDITFLIEGEEESGSRGFINAVRRHKSLIGKVDYIIIANSYWINDDLPCLTYGLRGVLHASILVNSDNCDVHSGVDGSFMINEPLSDLTAILAKLKGKKNRVMIPGFYDSILPLTPAENARFEDISMTLAQRNPETRSPDILKASLMARWREPNLTIHRYHVSGPNGSLVSSQASAAISLRLVPNQEVEDVTKSLVSFLNKAFNELESSNHLSIKIDNHADPWLGDPENAIFKTLEAAVMNVWGPIREDETKSSSSLSDNSDSISSLVRSSNNPSSEQALTESCPKIGNVDNQKIRRPMYIREGGSIPSIRFLEKEFRAPAAHLPCGQASDSAHLENERLRVINLYKSREIFRQVFKKLPRK